MKIKSPKIIGELEELDNLRKELGDKEKLLEKIIKDNRIENINERGKAYI